MTDARINIDTYILEIDEQMQNSKQVYLGWKPWPRRLKTGQALEGFLSSCFVRDMLRLIISKRNLIGRSQRGKWKD